MYWLGSAKRLFIMPRFPVKVYTRKGLKRGDAEVTKGRRRRVRAKLRGAMMSAIDGTPDASNDAGSGTSGDNPSSGRNSGSSSSMGSGGGGGGSGGGIGEGYAQAALQSADGPSATTDAFDAERARLLRKKAEYQKRLLRGERSIVFSQRARVVFQAKMTKDEKWLANAGKRSLIIMIVLLLSVAAWVAVRVFEISRKYSQMIHVLDNYSVTDGKSIGLPNMFMPLGGPGFNCAVACEYPALTGLLGYINGGFPYACYISVYSSTLRSCFLQNPAENLASMWNFALVGKNDVRAGSTTASLAIVCSSWGLKAGLRECENPCPPDSSPKWYDYATSMMGMMNAGLMVGQFIAPPFGLIGGAILGLAAGAAVEATKAKSKAQPQNCYKWE